MSISVVIPVYNQAHLTERCLVSLLENSLIAKELFVVDNNSTDRTVEIARKYSFVKVISEKHQHQVFAQAAGFNVANGDILGRIDADSILPPD